MKLIWAIVCPVLFVSPPVRGAWIEISGIPPLYNTTESPPVRGAWIEMIFTGQLWLTWVVASREGGVD